MSGHILMRFIAINMILKLLMLLFQFLSIIAIIAIITIYAINAFHAINAINANHPLARNHCHCMRIPKATIIVREHYRTR